MSVRVANTVRRVGFESRAEVMAAFERGEFAVRSKDEGGGGTVEGLGCRGPRQWLYPPHTASFALGGAQP